MLTKLMSFLNSCLVKGSDLKYALADTIIQPREELQKSLQKFCCTPQKKIILFLMELNFLHLV